jgi:stage V sporulation protein SpoVS
MFVAKSSNAGKVAGALLSRLEENPGTPVRLQSSGRNATYIALLALVYANNLFAMQQRRQLSYQPQIGRGSSETTSAATEVSAKAADLWSFYVRADPDQLPPTSDEIKEENIARVAEQTDAMKLANVIQRHVMEDGKFTVQAVGEGASYRAMKAINAARRALVQYNGVDLYVVPQRVQVQGSKEGSTGEGPTAEGSTAEGSSATWVNRLHLFKCDARPEDVERLRCGHEDHFMRIII